MASSTTAASNRTIIGIGLTTTVETSTTRTTRTQTQTQSVSVGCCNRPWHENLNAQYYKGFPGLLKLIEAVSI